MLYKRWRKERIFRSLALRDQLCERDSKPLQGASVKNGGLERCRKRQGNPCQVSTTELSESEPSDDASTDVTMTSEPGMGLFPGISLAGSSRSWLGGVRRKGDKNVVWALVRNSGTSRVVASPEIGGNGSTPRPKSRRREYRMLRIGVD